MQESLTDLRRSVYIQKGEKIFGRELQLAYGSSYRAEDVERSASLWQKNPSKVAVLSILIILGSVMGGVISGLIVKNLSEDSWWIVLGTALGFVLGILGASAPFYCKEICAVFKKENREIIL